MLWGGATQLSLGLLIIDLATRRVNLGLEQLLVIFLVLHDFREFLEASLLKSDLVLNELFVGAVRGIRC